MTRADAIVPQAIYWRCLHCDRQIGIVINSKLYVAGYHIVAGTIACRSCGHTRKWAPSEGRKAG